jgi:hypothetical protein
MIDCTRYRQAMLAQPHDADPTLREHRASCADCNLFSERLLRFESGLQRALRVPVADAGVPLRATAPRRRSPGFRPGWAMAAGVLMAVVVAGGLWLGVPRSSLAADVVTHMREEPQAWRRTDVPVPGAALQNVLRDAHMHLAAGAGVVSYANSCGFRGHQVPHLVMQTESGPVTVMVLVHEQAPKPVQFDEQGYRGVIVPVAGHGSLAVLTRGPTTDFGTIEHIAQRVLDSIVWTEDPSAARLQMPTSPSKSINRRALAANVG